MVGQLGNKTDGIGKDHIQIVGNRQLTGSGIQSVEQPIVGRNTCIGQLIQQRRFTRVGIAHNGHHRHRILHSPLPLHGTNLTHLLQFFLQPIDPFPDMTAVAFQLGFTGAAGTDAAALPAEALTHTGEPGQQILILGQFYLQTTFPGLGTLGKNIQDQSTAVQHRHTDDFLQRPDITGRKFIIEYHHGRLGGLHQHFHFLGLTLANKAVGVRSMAILQHFSGAKTTGRFQKCFQFFQGFIRGSLGFGEAIGIEAHQHRPFLQFSIHDLFHNTSGKLLFTKLAPQAQRLPCVKGAVKNL